MKIANAIAGVVVLSQMKMGGVYFISTDCQEGYKDFKKLPNVVEFEGVRYGKSGFDSDRGMAFYRSDMKVAVQL